MEHLLDSCTLSMADRARNTTARSKTILATLADGNWNAATRTKTILATLADGARNAAARSEFGGMGYCGCGCQSK